MRLPSLKFFNTAEYFFTPKGVDIDKNSEEYLDDAVNLEFKNDGCFSKRASKKALTLTKEMDQLITCKDRAFVRTDNTISEILSGEDGSFKLSKGIQLSNLDPPTDRTIVELNNRLYVFPDNIVIKPEQEEWKNFAESYSVSVKFPFIAANGLYYNANMLEGEVCYDATNLEAGTKLKFSWCGDTEYTVLKKEIANTMSDVGTIYGGYYIWLDKDVPYWGGVPSGATATYCHPMVMPMAPPFVFGFGDLTYNFMGNTLYFTMAENGVAHDDPPSDHLHVGQRVVINGKPSSKNNKEAIITNIFAGGIVFDTTFSDETSSQGEIITVTPVLPNADFALADSDRLWLLDNSQKRIWASANDKPHLFYENASEPEDSWWCNLSRRATALLVFKNQVYCFHESGCTRIYGSHALNFVDTTYVINGVPIGLEKTLAVIGDTLFYYSYTGIHKYNGSFSKLLSSKTLYDKNMSAMVDGGSYYILNGDRIWVYSSEKNNWHSEDGQGVNLIFSCHGRRCYLKSDGIYIQGDTDTAVPWSLTTHSIFEKDIIFPMVLKFKINSVNGTQFRVLISKNCGEFKELKVGTVSGHKTVYVGLPQGKCDEFKIKIMGEGDLNIENIFIKYRR